MNKKNWNDFSLKSIKYTVIYQKCGGGGQVIRIKRDEMSLLGQNSNYNLSTLISMFKYSLYWRIRSEVKLSEDRGEIK